MGVVLAPKHMSLANESKPDSRPGRHCVDLLRCLQNSACYSPMGFCDRFVSLSYFLIEVQANFFALALLGSPARGAGAKRLRGFAFGEKNLSVTAVPCHLS